MGVPAFFRWLSEKYPKIIEDILEERVQIIGTQGTIRAPFDCTKPNPSGLECDNLYIDMNGIIHPCSHPEQGPQPSSEEEMYENVCMYVDRLFRVMRPRKLLYLAIDGVAPRAKMNQQRARRFRSAQEAREQKEIEENVRGELSQMGQDVPPAKDAWDSNVITPGTPFMLRLSEYLRFYIRKRLSTDKAWKQIRVIFSDASIPGEGEHKIMAHIRLQRSQPGYLPNQVHIIHGLDADLVMLGLATHEAHFYISREEVLFGRKSQEQTDHRQQESGFRDSQKQLDEVAGDAAMMLPENKQKPLVRLSIPTLREYLAVDFAECLDPNRLPFTPSLERLIDDIVFLCFFVGNDFLPHLPSLDIRDGALDFLFNVYKRILPTLGDYITSHGGKVNLSHVDVILAEVGAIEDYVFQMKHENQKREEERREQQKARQKASKGRSMENPQTAVVEQRKVVGRAARILEKQEQRALKQEKGERIKASHMGSQDNAKAAQALKAMLGTAAVKKEDDVKAESDISSKDVTASVKVEVSADGADVKMEDSHVEDVKREDEAASSGVDSTKGTKRKLEEAASDDIVGEVGDAEDEFDDDEEDDEEKPAIDLPSVSLDPNTAKIFKEKVKSEQQKQLDHYAKTVEDKVRLHESGWKDRYYSDKCKADDVQAHGGREHLFRSYVVGLCWVMKYYYDGVPSWKWYYPFHYAPFASDLRNIERFSQDCKNFELSNPFNPIEQLMAVLPSDSSHAIPKPSRWLMEDPESPIIDFYPRDVPVDPNGKAMPWLWVVLLPFIEEERLLAALTPTMAKWTKTELLCNARGLDDGYLYISSSHSLARKLSPIVQSGKTANSPKQRLTDSSSYGCPGFSGSIRPPLSNEVHPFGDDEKLLPPATSEKVVFQSPDNIFTEPIEGHSAICISFTEPPKLSHKSILLPGAKAPNPVLTDSDRRIQRPRLNRGGSSIAYMGGGTSSNGRSHQSGYGSMNIGAYERDLASRTGRSNQMYQAGTRAWGAMEPTPKRVYRAANPFMPGQQNPSQQRQPQPWQQQSRGAPPPPPPPPPPGGSRPGFHPNQYRMQPQGQRGSSGYPPNQRQGYRPPSQQHQQPQRWNPPQAGRAIPNQRTPPGQGAGGFNFRSFSQQQSRQPQRPPQNQGRPAARANANVMSSLKAQLASTLQQNRRQDRR